MGLLLMQFEYQRAIQKKTVLEHKGVRLNNLHDLYTKRIGNIEKLFSKKKTQLESRYTQLNSQISASINRASIDGGIDVSALGSIFGVVASTALTSLSGLVTKDLTNISSMDRTTTEGLNKYNAAKSAIMSQLQSALQTILNDIKEIELEELEAQEDAQTEPIAEKDTEMQAEIAVNDSRLTMADQRAESAKQRLAQVTKDSMAHYGLNA